MIDTVQHLYRATQIQTLGENRAPTGIFKDPVSEVDINELGILNDIQADKRVHGGPEKALHQFAQRSYAVFHQAFPELAPHLNHGKMGENISSVQLHEDNVHIGDIYRMGTLLVQVSQPRQPCWKINDKFNHDQLAKFISEQAINGWYYRVLEGGRLTVGNAITLEQRSNTVSIKQFLNTYHEHRPHPDQLHRLAHLEGLTPQWRVKLLQRWEYLKAK